MGSFSLMHWLVVGLVIIVFFGRGKISDIMGDVARGIRSFKKGLNEDDAPKVEASKATEKDKV